MEIFAALAGALKFGLSLLDTKEGRDIYNQVVEAETEYYEELKRPEDGPDGRSQLYLDERMLKLTTISKNLHLIPRGK
jgi:hypothetical protein